MRLWSLHPQHLDRAGLGALWREGLGARVSLRRRLEGQRTGYAAHSQLERWAKAPDPLGALDAYLHHVVDEADRRGYNYARHKLTPRASLSEPYLLVTSGQLDFEARWLREKLSQRAPQWLALLPKRLVPHPTFIACPGSIASWEKGAPSEERIYS